MIECSTGEMAETYEEYLKTEHWSRFRQRYMDSPYRYECALCAHNRGLHLHHLTYDRIGNEHLKDCIWLCTDHHRLVHQAIDKGRPPRISHKIKLKFNGVRSKLIKYPRQI